MPVSPPFGFVIEYVKDVEAARRFYVDVMGLKEERYHPAYVQFEHFAIASDESVSGTKDVEVYWLIDDADAVHAELSQKTEVGEIRQFPFGRVVTVTSPEGVQRFLLEFAKNRPSQAV